MTRSLYLVLILLCNLSIKAQGPLAEAIAKILPPAYKLSTVISSHDEKTAEGMLVLSIPQNNNCFGGDTAYITISYVYYSKSNLPTKTEISQRKAAFDLAARNNHKETIESMDKGLFNTLDKEYISCSELTYGIHSQAYYYHYLTKLKCKGYAKGVTPEMVERLMIESDFDVPDEILQQHFQQYHYTDIYMTAKADESIHQKNISIIFYGTSTYNEAKYHTQLLLDLFVSLEYNHF